MPIILSNVSVAGLRLFNTCHAHFQLICCKSSSGHLLHAEDHMPFATAQREKPQTQERHTKPRAEITFTVASTCHYTLYICAVTYGIL